MSLIVGFTLMFMTQLDDDHASACHCYDGARDRVYGGHEAGLGLFVKAIREEGVIAFPEGAKLFLTCSKAAAALHEHCSYCKYK